MRNIYSIVAGLFILVASSQGFAATLKILDTPVLADPNNSKSAEYIDQRFILNAKEFGTINVNVCNILPRDYFPRERERIEALQLAVEKNVSVEAEVTFSGKAVGKDACVSAVKILAK